MENIIYNDGKVIIFPITLEETQMLNRSKKELMEHLNIQYCCDDFETKQEIEDRITLLKNKKLDWQNYAYWLILKIDERKVVGYMKLTKENDVITLKNFLSKGINEEILIRANILLKQYEKDYNNKIFFAEYKLLNEG